MSFSVVLQFIFIFSCQSSADRNQIRNIKQDVRSLRSLHYADFLRLENDIHELKSKCLGVVVNDELGGNESDTYEIETRMENVQNELKLLKAQLAEGVESDGWELVFRAAAGNNVNVYKAWTEDTQDPSSNFGQK